MARSNGVPSLIRSAVKALAVPDVTLHSWGCKEEILRYVAVEEVAAIARMRERLLTARLAILEVPPVNHAADCTDMGSCVQAWEYHWNTVIRKKIWKLHDGTSYYQLWYIRSMDILQAEVHSVDGYPSG